MRFPRLSAVLLVAVVALVGCQGTDVINSDQPAAQNYSIVPLANNTVPFHAKVQNTLQVVPPFPPPILNAVFEGEGKTRPFGHFLFSGTSQIDVTVFPFDQVTQYVFTFRNGDELYMTSHGTSIEDPPGNAVFSGDFTIIGGTGIFTNATGSGTYAGTADVAAGVGQFDMDGFISGFGGNGN
jgi:hypothetical protein